MDSLTNSPFCTSPGDTMYVGYVVGTEEHGSRIRIYPNPVSDYLAIESDRNIGEACLFDYLGRIVVSKNGISQRQTHLLLSGLAPGVYMLRVLSCGHVEVKKIIKE